ncbi:MAG: conserved phage C-terminal domain-containing protein [Collinsella intestinalis]
MQVLDSLIDGPLQLSNAREGDELIGNGAMHRRRPSPRTGPEDGLPWRAPCSTRAGRASSGRAGGSANGAQRARRDAEGAGDGSRAEVGPALNRAAGTAFRDTSKKTRSLIRARWAEGYRLEDFEAVVEEKAAQWSGDAKMRAYLRPETLFSPKFEGYREEARAAAQRPGKGALDAYAEL